MQQSKLGVGVALLFVSLLLAGSAVDAEATIYRWVSPGGVVSYGENPPANASHVETLDGMPMVTAPSTSSEPAAPVAMPPKPEAREPLHADAREHRVLETELAAARLQLLQATQAYEKGKAVRYGNERNYARYLQRIDSLKQAVHDAQLRVLLLQHQLQQGSAGADTMGPQS
ncbi:DUF4124 domain-containing protein [Acidithiobacillus sp. IBUN Pt1247-S3]|uniref:DUF4124 domain-containing protein n=1 Tax=Acidithiobacillus sp. IBUN Pt1247-S3 TaxID=3166642 RepID=UPI0034E5853F